MSVSNVPFPCPATPAPAEKLERNGKETEKEEEREDGEAAADKERGKEKERDEGREVENNRTAEPEEVGGSCSHPCNDHI